MNTLAASAWKLLARGTSNFFSRHGPVYSAAIAFNLLLSIIPVTFLVFAAISWFLGRDEVPFRELSKVLRATFPFGADVLVQNVRKLFGSKTTFGIVGSGLLLLTSFSATDAVHTSLGVMLGRPRGKRIWRSALFHVALVLCLIVLAGAAVAVPPVWNGLIFLTKKMPAYWGGAFLVLLGVVADIVLAAILFAGAILSYRYLSPVRVGMKNAVAGASLFVALMHAIRLVFRFYVGKFGRLSLIYGSLFGIVSFIIVAYLFAAAFLFCASIIGELESG